MHDLAYILAASHSGSTLLAMLAGSHPRAFTAGELKATNLGDPDQYRCSCGVWIRECRFWSSVQEGMARRGIEFDITDAKTDFRNVGQWYVDWLLTPLVRGRVWECMRDVALTASPVWRERLREIQRRNVALVDTIRELAGAHVVVDSSKVGLRLKYLLRNPCFRIRVIHLIRDGRGVALSHMDPARFADAKDPSSRGGGTGSSRDSERLSMAAAAREWVRSNEEAEALLEGLDRSQWTQVRYEDLCRDPRAVMDRLFGFLGLETWNAVNGFRRADLHVLGNGMRFDRTTEVCLDERWREVLTDRELEEFDTVAGSMNRRYGYR